MKTFIKLVAFSFLLASCSSQKTMPEKTVQEYQQKGYTLGTIASKSTGDCPWVITVSDSNVQYDPINIDETKFATLKTKKTAFFFKFLPLRQMNRCDNTAPIQLTEVVTDQ
jgi:hypothetical protein